MPAVIADETARRRCNVDEGHAANRQLRSEAVLRRESLLVNGLSRGIEHGNSNPPLGGHFIATESNRGAPAARGERHIDRKRDPRRANATTGRRGEFNRVAAWPQCGLRRRISDAKKHGRWRQATTPDDLPIQTL